MSAESNPNMSNGIMGLIMTIFLGGWSWLMNLITGLDGILVVPLMHFVQILVAAAGILAALSTASPHFREVLNNKIKNLMK